MLSRIKNPVEGVDIQLEMLKLLAELCVYCETLENPKETIQIIFDKLLEYMPLPTTEENSENSVPQDVPKLEFSYVECLMFAFHKLGRKYPEFLTSDESTELLKDFKLRFVFF